MSRPRIFILWLWLLAVYCRADTPILSSVGVTVGSIDNPFYQMLVRGISHAALSINPHVKITTQSAEFSLTKQQIQINDFIASRVDIIVLVAADPVAIEPSVRRARQAGIVVIAADVDAAGANGSVETDNVQAGMIACQFLAEQIHGHGKFIMQSGPHVSSVIDRLVGCHKALQSYTDITVLNDTESGQASVWGGMTLMADHLKRYPHVDAVFAINDRQAIGAETAAKKAGRQDMIIASVDGSPDIEQVLHTVGQVVASSSQDPFLLGVDAVQLGEQMRRGTLTEFTQIKVPAKLVTRENLMQYRGWTSLDNPLSIVQ